MAFTSWYPYISFAARRRRMSISGTPLVKFAWARESSAGRAMEHIPRSKRYHALWIKACQASAPRQKRKMPREQAPWALMRCPDAECERLRAVAPVVDDLKEVINVNDVVVVDVGDAAGLTPVIDDGEQVIDVDHAEDGRDVPRAGVRLAFVRDAVAVGVEARAALDVAAVGDAVVIAIDFIGEAWALINAISDAVAVGVGVSDAASADAGGRLERVVRATVKAVERAVAVGVDIGRAAAADSRSDLERISGAPVEAIGGAVAVGIGVNDAAAALARRRLQRIGRAAVDAIGGSVAVCIGVGRSAAADA